MKSQGISLIETIVVIAIVAILCIVGVSVAFAVLKSNDGAVKVVVNNVLQLSRVDSLSNQGYSGVWFFVSDGELIAALLKRDPDGDGGCSTCPLDRSYLGFRIVREVNLGRYDVSEGIVLFYKGRLVIRRVDIFGVPELSVKFLVIGSDDVYINQYLGTLIEPKPSISDKSSPADSPRFTL